MYSPSTTVKGDKPTPLRVPNGGAIDAVDTPTAAAPNGSAASSSASSNPAAAAVFVGTRTVSEDMNAVQGASSLLSLRSGLPAPVPTAKTHERFLLTAADPVDGANDEARLLVVLQAKYEAGLLKPYDYGAAYARFQRYLETRCGRRRHMHALRCHRIPAVAHAPRVGREGPGPLRAGPACSMTSLNRQRVQTALSTFRPAFQAMAQSLTDMEVIRVEESFERMLLVRRWTRPTP